MPAPKQPNPFTRLAAQLSDLRESVRNAEQEFHAAKNAARDAVAKAKAKFDDALERAQKALAAIKE